MRSLKLTTVVLLSMILILGLGTAAIQAKDEMVLRMGRITEPEGYCPHTTIGRVAREVFTILYDRLVYVDEEGEIHPWLAKSWEISDDYKEITFTLEEGVTFHDGTILDAAAVKFNFDRILEVGGTAADQFPAMTIEVVDDYVVKFSLADVYAPFFHSLASPFGGIASPTAIQEHRENYFMNPVGSGPFMFEKHIIGDEIVFKANPNYKNFRTDIENKGAPYVDKVIYYAIPEETTRGSALLTGEVDIIETGAVTALRLANSPGIYQADSKAINITQVGFNHRRAPFDDLNVRKAVGYALDIEELTILGFFDYATPNYTFIPVGVMGYNEELGEKYGFHQDQAKAIALLEEAGYQYVNGAMVKDGRQLEVDLLTHYAHFTEQVSEGVQAQLAEIGVKANIVLMDVGTFLTRGSEPETNQLFFMRTTWGEPIILSRLFLGGGPFESFNDPVLDAMLNKATTIMDFEERQGLLDEINIYILENAMALPVFSNEVIFYASDAVEGYKVDAQNFMILNDVKVNR